MNKLFTFPNIWILFLKEIIIETPKIFPERIREQVFGKVVVFFKGGQKEIILMINDTTYVFKKSTYNTR